MSKRNNKSYRRQQSTLKAVKRAGEIRSRQQLRAKGMYHSMIYKGKKAVERSRESNE